jgi:predicted alpha/beta hydrolase
MSEASASERLEYCTSDGHRVSAQVFRASDFSAPLLVCLPAMGVAASYYARFAAALSAEGMHVVLSDLRGLGSSSLRASRRCDFGYHEILTRDLPALLHATLEVFPSNWRLLLGHSLGGQLWSLYLSANPAAASGLVTIASCNVYYQGWQFPLNYRVLGTALFLRSLGALFGYVPAGRFGFAGNEARTLVVDWSNNCRSGSYVPCNDPADYEGALQRLMKPVLAVSFEHDRLAPKRSVDNLVVKMRAAQLTRKHLSASDLGLERVNHFNWARSPANLVGEIRAWVDGAKSQDRLQPMQ